MAKKPQTVNPKTLSEAELREHNQACQLPIGSDGDKCRICAYLVKKFEPSALPVEELRLHSERCAEAVHLCPLCNYYMNDLAVVN